MIDKNDMKRMSGDLSGRMGGPPSYQSKKGFVVQTPLIPAMRPIAFEKPFNEGEDRKDILSHNTTPSSDRPVTVATPVKRINPAKRFQPLYGSELPTTGFFETLKSDNQIPYLVGVDPAREESSSVPVQAVPVKVVNVRKDESNDSEDDQRIIQSDNRLPNIVNLPRAISKVSNQMKDYINSEDLFNKVRSNLTDKRLYMETFYTKVGNCLYHSLLNYLDVQKNDDDIILPVIDKDTACLSTLYFLDRLYNYKGISFEKNASKVMSKYRRIFGDHEGIQLEWIPFFTEKMKEKLPLELSGIEEIVSAIMYHWCQTNIKDSIEPDERETVEEVQAEVVVPVSTAQAVVVGPSFEGTIIQNPANLDEDDDDGDDDEENDYNGIEIQIMNDGDLDIVTVVVGDILISMYLVLRDISIESKYPSLADDRNGIWDWLIHFPADKLFTTDDPEKYLKGNDSEISSFKFVILEEDTEKGIFYMGGYLMSGVFYIDDDENELPYDPDDLEIVAQINNIVKKNIATSDISHLARTMSHIELFETEEELNKEMEEFNRGYDDDDSDDDDDEGDVEQVQVKDENIDPHFAAAMEFVAERSATQEPEIDNNSATQDKPEVEPEFIGFGPSEDKPTYEPWDFTPQTKRDKRKRDREREEKERAGYGRDR